MTYIRRWWMRDVMDMYIKLPFFCLRTVIMSRCDYDLTYTYLEFSIKIYKWHFAFRVGDNIRRLAKKIDTTKRE